MSDSSVGLSFIHLRNNLYFQVQECTIELSYSYIILPCKLKDYAIMNLHCEVLEPQIKNGPSKQYRFRQHAIKYLKTSAQLDLIAFAPMSQDVLNNTTSREDSVNITNRIDLTQL
jgi:hypothetical protein